MNATKTCLLIYLAVTLGGCAQYVKRHEFDTTVADLRAADAALRAEQGDLRAQLELMASRFDSLTQELTHKFDDYNAQIARLQGRLRVDMTAHFAYDDATLREEDKYALEEFSAVLRDYHDNVLVTVEGFTDPAGPAEYNRQLGLRRAKSVREYLLQTGLSPDKVRAVSYGEDSNRQVNPGAWGANGAANRRVALVIDYVAG